MDQDIILDIQWRLDITTYHRAREKCRYFRSVVISNLHCNTIIQEYMTRKSSYQFSYQFMTRLLKYSELVSSENLRFPGREKLEMFGDNIRFKYKSVKNSVRVLSK